MHRTVTHDVNDITGGAGLLPRGDDRNVSSQVLGKNVLNGTFCKKTSQSHHLIVAIIHMMLCVFQSLIQCRIKAMEPQEAQGREAGDTLEACQPICTRTHCTTGGGHTNQLNSTNTIGVGL